MILRNLAVFGLLWGALSLALLLAAVLWMAAAVAVFWLRLISRLANEQPRGRAAARSRPAGACDGLVTARGDGRWIIDARAGHWPRQWPIAGARRFLPGDEWSARYDMDGARGLVAARDAMAKGRGEGANIP